MDCFQLMPALKWCKCFMTETYETVSCVRIFCLEKGRGLWKASQALSSYIFFFLWVKKWATSCKCRSVWCWRVKKSSTENHCSVLVHQPVSYLIPFNLNWNKNELKADRENICLYCILSSAPNPKCSLLTCEFSQLSKLKREGLLPEKREYHFSLARSVWGIF